LVGHQLVERGIHQIDVHGLVDGVVDDTRGADGFIELRGVERLLRHVIVGLLLRGSVLLSVLRVFDKHGGALVQIL